jgi:DNA-binding beta-propeller fold protein YncE
MIETDMPTRWKTLAKLALAALAALLLVAAVFAARLILPGTPSAAGSLRFEGYVPLPKSAKAGALTILDYLSVSGRNLFVSNESTGDVYKVNLASGVLPGPADVSVFALEPATHGIVVDPTSGLAFVSRSEANTVDVFDPAAMRLVKRIPVADDVDGIFYDPYEKRVYAASGDPKLATLIDPATQAKVGVIALGGKPEFAAIDPRTRLMLQNLTDNNTLAAVDVAHRAVVARWPLTGCEGPTGIAIDPVLRRGFIVCSKNAALVVFDLDAHHVTASMPIGGGPDAVAFDPVLRRLYATGRSGVLSVIQQDGPDIYRVLDTVHLHYGAHTLAIDPVTHRLFVGYASLILPARLAVFSAIR